MRIPVNSSGGSTPPVITAVKTADYTAAIGEIVRVNFTAVGWTLTLPPISAGNTGKTVIIYNTDTPPGGNGLTVLPSAGNTIDGVSLAQWSLQMQSVTYTSDGVSNWMLTSKA